MRAPGNVSNRLSTEVRITRATAKAGGSAELIPANVSRKPARLCSLNGVQACVFPDRAEEVHTP